MARKKIDIISEKVSEPIIPYGDTPLSFEKVWLLFQQTDRKMQENERIMRESDRELKELISNMSK